MKERMANIILLVMAMAAGYVGGLLGQTNARAEAVDSTPTTADVLRVKRLQLIDANGKVRGELGMMDGGPGFWLTDEAGTPGVVLGMSTNGEPGVTLADAAGNGRGMFGMQKGEPTLTLDDTKSSTRAQLTTVKGEPRLTLYDAAGKVLGEFGVEKGKSRMRLRSGTGKITWQTP